MHGMTKIIFIEMNTFSSEVRSLEYQLREVATKAKAFIPLDAPSRHATLSQN